MAKRIAELEESLLSSESALDYEEFEARRTQIEAWRSTYLRQQNIPTWPVDFETLGKFLNAQIALWVGIPVSLAEHWEKLKPAWEIIKSLGPQSAS